MREFFRGSRRKIGSLLLLVACVLTGGWIRSFSIMDGFGFHPTLETTAAIISIRGCGVIIFIHKLSGFGPSAENFTESRRLVESDQFWPHPEPDTPWRWHWHIGEMEFGKVNGLGIMCDQTLIVFPYWTIVLPFGLISLLFLLSKPQKSIQKKITEPINDERGA